MTEQNNIESIQRLIDMTAAFLKMSAEEIRSPQGLPDRWETTIEMFARKANQYEQPALIKYLTSCEENEERRGLLIELLRLNEELTRRDLEIVSARASECGHENTMSESMRNTMETYRTILKV